MLSVNKTEVGYEYSDDRLRSMFIYKKSLPVRPTLSGLNKVLFCINFISRIVKICIHIIYFANLHYFCIIDTYI